MIDASGREESKMERDNYIAQEKARITEEYKGKLAQDEIKLKIQKSAHENAARISRMKTVNDLT